MLTNFADWFKYPVTDYNHSSSSEETKQKFYGFDLDQFQDFDPKNPGKDITPNYGDILLCYDKNNKPYHMLFASEKTSENEVDVWKGVGLGNINSYLYGLTDQSVEDLKQKYNEWYMEPMKVKYIPLTKALESLHS